MLLVRPPLADVDAFLADVASYAALGVTEVQVMPDRHPVEFAEQVADKIAPRSPRSAEAGNRYILAGEQPDRAGACHEVRGEGPPGSSHPRARRSPALTVRRLVPSGM